MSVLARGWLVWLCLLPTWSAGTLDFALARWQADPEVRVQDAYKWLFQATMGGEHAVDSADDARSWLNDEWATLGPPAAGEREWEPLTADGAIGRVNLRPYRARGGDRQRLADAFYRSAQSFRTDRDAFLSQWRELGRRLQERSFGVLTYDDWQVFDRDARARSYDSVHHSPSYEQARRPAYRVIMRAEAEAIGAIRR